VQVILSTPSSPLAHGLSIWSLAPSLLALVAYALAAMPGAGAWARRCLPLAWGLHGVAGLAHLLGIGLAMQGARFGFAPALSATAWMVLAVHAVESRFVPLPGVRRLLAVLGAGTLALALLFPGEGGLHPGSPWAPLHWMLGLASYGLVAAAVLHAAWLDRAERAMRLRLKTPGASGTSADKPTLPLLTLEKLTYRFVGAGFVVLSLALALGVWFTPVWHWDHKAVFSLLGWAVLAGLLAGRQAFGWRGRLATRGLYVGAVLLLLAYVGSRFVLEVLLHRTAAHSLSGMGLGLGA
jgi:ABC-type uncharacterized transport system permease subunit